MRSSSLVAVLVWILADVSRALACGPVEYSYTIEDISPADGTTGFARDGAVLLTVRQHIVSDIRDRGTVIVRVAKLSNSTDTEVAGQLDTLEHDTRMTWRPTTPLDADTTYQLTVSVQGSDGEPLDGPQVSTFTTSDVLSSELTLEGELRAALRAGEADVCAPCASNCGCDCEVVGRRPALYADVQLPRVRGGFDAYDYRAWLILTDQQPRTFDGPGEGTRRADSHVVNLMRYLHVDEDTAQVTMEIPDESEPYPACFAFNAWDPAGHWRSAAPLCVPADEIEAAFEDASPAGDGCSVAAPSGAGRRSLGATWWLGLGLFVVAAVGRRARARRLSGSHKPPRRRSAR